MAGRIEAARLVLTGAWPRSSVAVVQRRSLVRVSVVTIVAREEDGMAANVVESFSRHFIIQGDLLKRSGGGCHVQI